MRSFSPNRRRRWMGVRQALPGNSCCEELTQKSSTDSGLRAPVGCILTPGMLASSLANLGRPNSAIWRFHQASCPPSTKSKTPLTKSASRDARNAAGPATSSGTPILPSGIRFSYLAAKAG